MGRQAPMKVGLALQRRRPGRLLHRVQMGEQYTTTATPLAPAAIHSERRVMAGPSQGTCPLRKVLTDV